MIVCPQDMTDKLTQFTKFLTTIDLTKYRKQYLPIKIVEMDMPKNIQAISLLYKIYWNDKVFLSFEDFYKKYSELYKKDLELFRKKTQMCKKCFAKGLPARIYRTWASIITQIHGGYVAESIFGVGTTFMSADLDHKGADFRIVYHGKGINYQVKKTTHSREVRREKTSKDKLDGLFITINYEVPDYKIFANPKKKDGTYKAAYSRFINNKTIQRLPNGFIIFTPECFKAVKNKIEQNEPLS